MYSLVEQPQLPYGTFNTPWSPGSTLTPFWDLEKLHTSSTHLPCTHPELSLTSDWRPTPSDPEETTSGLSWALGLFWLSCTWVTWTDETRGEGQVFQDPSTGGFLSIQSSLVFLSKAGQLGCPKPIPNSPPAGEWGGSNSGTLVASESSISVV